MESVSASSDVAAAPGRRRLQLRARALLKVLHCHRKDSVTGPEPVQMRAMPIVRLLLLMLQSCCGNACPSDALWFLQA